MTSVSKMIPNLRSKVSIQIKDFGIACLSASILSHTRCLGATCLIDQFNRTNSNNKNDNDDDDEIGALILSH